MKEQLSSPETPADSIVVTAARLPLAPSFRYHDITTFWRRLSEHYSHVDPIGNDILRLAIWERNPTFAKKTSGEVVPVKELAKLYFLKPQQDSLDVFSTQGDATGDLHRLYDIGIIDGSVEWTVDDLRDSNVPLYSVCWDENADPARGVGLSRNVRQLRDEQWSKVPEVMRQVVEAGLLNWSIKSDYHDEDGLGLGGITFINNSGLLLYVSPANMSEEQFAKSVGKIVNTIYTDGPGLFLSKEKTNYALGDHWL